MATIEEKMTDLRKSTPQAGDDATDFERFQKGKKSLAIDEAKKSISITSPLDAAIEGGKYLYEEETGKEFPVSEEASALGTVLTAPRKVAGAISSGIMAGGVNFARGAKQIFGDDTEQDITHRAMVLSKRPLKPSDYASNAPELTYLKKNPEIARKLWGLGVISTEMLNFAVPTAPAPKTPTMAQVKPQEKEPTG